LAAPRESEHFGQPGTAGQAGPSSRSRPPGPDGSAAVPSGLLGSASGADRSARGDPPRPASDVGQSVPSGRPGPSGHSDHSGHPGHSAEPVSAGAPDRSHRPSGSGIPGGPELDAPDPSDAGADDVAVADDEWWIPPCDGAPPTDEERAALWQSDSWSGPPYGQDERLASLTSPELEAIADAMAPPVPDALPAGFWHRDGGSGPGFVAGGSLDLLPPGAVLASFVEEAQLTGLSELSDDEVIGFMCAGRRLSSWAAAAELTAVTELDRRRLAAKARRSSVDSEHVSEELAAALTLTGWAADSLLDLSRRLSRLPAVMAGLGEGSVRGPGAGQARPRRLGPARAFGI
jgi:hypothetical protein